MKKHLVMFLALISFTVWADWVIVAKSESGDMSFYVDPGTIRKDGQKRKFWKMVDLKKRNKNGDSSFRSRDELDCKEEKYRTLQLTAFSESMLSGNMNGNFDMNSNWTFIAPGTLDEAVMEYVCRK